MISLKKCLILLVFIVFNKTLSTATHLVGGEIELIHISGDRYILRQNQYFDAIHGNPDILTNPADQTLDIYAYSKRNNANVGIFQVFLITYFEVPYFNPECDDSQVKTLKLIFEGEITLSADIYNDDWGYYFVWERCCRNNHITNIQAPENTGQTFYMEFPAVVKNNQPFINSSPTLFPPIGDYACRNQLFYFDFSGSDPDGDSLVYRLSAPMSDSDSNDPLPTPQPGPYSSVSFVSGVNVNNMIPGSPSLGISWDGFLTVKPSQTGLFVFAIKCEEFRNGIKIGEVRRDYQLLVVANCSPGTPPQIVMSKGAGPVQSGKVKVVFDKSDPERCLNISVTDLDLPEKVRLLMRPLNFSGLEDLIPDTTATLQNASDALDVQICFPDCPAFTNEPYKMYILALDDACTFPLIDTLHIEVSYKDFDQQIPYFDNVGDEIELLAQPGESFQLPIKALDDDGDTVSVILLNSSIPPSLFNAGFNFQSRSPGTWNGQFNWTFNCNNSIYDSIPEVVFTLVALDKNACLTSLSDTLLVRLKIDVEENIAPIIQIADYQENDTLYAQLGETITLQVSSSDLNIGDPLDLKLNGDNLDFDDLGINFTDKNGSTNISSNFQWAIPCGKLNLSIQDVFIFEFTSQDSKNCRPSITDTLRFIVKISPLANEAPEITIYNLPASDTIEVLAETELILNFDALDSPQDSVLISLTDSDGFQQIANFDLELSNGKGIANGQITWTPSCDLLGPNGESTTFRLNVVTSDRNACKQTKAAEQSFNVTIYNIDEIPGYTPVNAITPNGDAYNQEFYLPNLPPDNCVNRFESVEIVNRWGRKVFYSENRNFRWDGNRESAGVYFYTIRFTNRTIISPIHVLY